MQSIATPDNDQFVKVMVMQREHRLRVPFGNHHGILVSEEIVFSL
ncbi:hypothetical protein [Pectobacterium polonicum]